VSAGCLDFFDSIDPFGHSAVALEQQRYNPVLKHFQRAHMDA
jgi:hypothetical protein